MISNYSNYDKEKVLKNKESFEKFLFQLEKEFYIHDFKIDNRYQCVGRHRFLIDEMEQLYYSPEICKSKHLNVCPTIWCLDSVIELITNPNFLNLSDYEKISNDVVVYANKNVNECRSIFDEYNKSDIISLNERDYILHAINMIKDSLKKCDDNLNWNSIDNSEEKLKSYMDEFINQPLPEPTDLDKEFDKYCELYKEKFGKNAYVAEPGGTKEKTIDAIKECLEKNEDILDKLLYPNFEDDMNNGSLY